MTKNIELRSPVVEDGMAVNQLIALCPPLDTNSSYCNFLQAGHFARTAVVAELQGELVGFISGYRLPESPKTLFIWQVAVSEAARGQGLASSMLMELLTRPGNEDINKLHTTITQTNDASWSLFKALANTLDAPLNHDIWLKQDIHFQGQHDSEYLVEIGPIKRPINSH